ncbi:fasciclin domain-containing protein [Kutzneria buriramensis]|uniref:Putative surface protein with fasciclin (FAS1) repeats n=1 Tax=Kutzneria buriramensis TaxID=1045776 RepID=A0A3E0GZ21_9PSEU|nr:fasciclin domain-containing protein [Kutzneria buriramensis]REH35643.1 putative surface protein with fasciclin (FAS1) repeats [Kutzneria buriramensis]
MRTFHRVAAAAVITTAAVSLAACGNGTASSGASSTTSMAPTTTTTTSASDGVTKTSDTFGPACGQIPSSGKGSLNGMASDPVATAASNNPLLTKLVAAVGAANLGDTLNSQKAITVFAPYDPAFDALGADKFAALAKDPATLAPILQYHVLPQRFDADGLIAAGSEKTLQGGTVKISGDKTSGMTVNGAKVLCGNIPTGNATVFVIDKVLTPGS